MDAYICATVYCVYEQYYYSVESTGQQCYSGALKCKQ